MANINILFAGDAARRLEGNDDVMRRFVMELPRTRMIIRELLRQDPSDSDAEQRVVGKRSADTWNKVRNHQASVVVQDDEVAGMAYYDEVGQHDERQVFEIGGNVVLPEFRGANLGKELAENCMEQVFAKNPNAYCLGQSSTPAILQRYQKWIDAGIARPLKPEAYEDMRRKFKGEPLLTPEERAQVPQWYAGCEIILIDLQKWKQSQGSTDK